jgi:hypothetical protein
VTASSDADTQGAEVDRDRGHLTQLHLAVPWCGLGFLAAWKIQSQMATTATVGLATLVSIWAALAVMLVWSCLATFAYYRGREWGVPDLLSKQPLAAETGAAPWLTRIRGAAILVLKALLAGIQPFIFSRTCCRVLAKPAIGWRTRMARIAVLGFGLTLFGVTNSHHMLREAGYPDDKALRISLFGSLLNVSYRVCLSAILFHGASEFLFLFQPLSP